MEFQGIDLSTFDPRNVDWTQFDPRNIEFSKFNWETMPSDVRTWAESEQGRQFMPFLLVLISLFLVWRFIRLRGGGQKNPSLARATRGTRLFGYAIILLFFGGFGTWASVASLASAALAPGIISPDGSRKTIQHLEGGIVEKIHVRDGETVQAGQPLITLQNTRALAQYEELQERHIFLLATSARLKAEEKGSEVIEFPRELLVDTDDASALAVAGQKALFNSGREVQIAREKILGQRIAQLEEEISGLTELIGAEDEQLDLISTEIAAAKELVAKKLMRSPQFLELQREHADMRGQRATNRASIARIRQQIGETELQLLATRQQDQKTASSEHADIRAELATIRTQLPDRLDRLSRTVIVAPTTGRVMDVRVTTEAGGVIGAGEPILDLVPEDAALVVDARVSPQDVDSVVPGMRARIVLTAFNQRYLPQVHGRVRSISADRLTDDRTGEPYFLAKVDVDTDELDALDQEVDLVAGMSVEVMILTGDQTLVDIIAKPIVDSVRRSFRDGS